MKTDLNYLKEMSGEDPDLMKELIDIFSEQVNELRVEMQELLNNEEYVSLGKVAHKAKTSVAIMGMDELAGQLKQLELLSKKGTHVNNFQHYIDAFKNETEEAIKELIEFRNSLT